MLKKVKWGIIGCGDVTEVKSGPAFNLVENSELVAVMRRTTAKAMDYADRHNVPKWYDDVEKLLDDPDVNAVYIATPPSTHKEYTLAAAERGKPVYVEKPMADNAQECIDMIEACDKAGVPLFVAYYRRELPYFRKAEELIKSGAIGDVRTVALNLLLPPYEVDFDKENLPWRVIPSIAGAGYFYDLASHQLDYLDLLFGPVKQASGYAVNLGGLYDAEDTVSGAFVFENGITGTGKWSFAAGEASAEDSIIISGTKGSIQMGCFERYPLKLTTAEGVQEIDADWPQHIQQPLIQTIVDELTGTGSCRSTGVTGARTNKVMDDILGKL